jgi:hypothetical protein
MSNFEKGDIQNAIFQFGIQGVGPKSMEFSGNSHILGQLTRLSKNLRPN